MTAVITTMATRAADEVDGAGPVEALFIALVAAGFVAGGLTQVKSARTALALTGADRDRQLQEMNYYERIVRGMSKHPRIQLAFGLIYIAIGIIVGLFAMMILL